MPWAVVARVGHPVEKAAVAGWAGLVDRVAVPVVVVWWAVVARVVD